MKSISHTLITCYLLFTTCYLSAQPFTHADTLRGSNGPGRDWWDVQRYDLAVKFNIADSSINGLMLMEYKQLKKGNIMQIDLQQPLIIDSIEYYYWNKISKPTEKDIYKKTIQKVTDFTRDGNAYFITPPFNGEYQYVQIFYHGKPTIAVKPPWDGGLVEKKDKLGRSWVSIACQGLGSSVWYPCKDYQGDEPDDGASLTITAPDTLISISNGRLTDTTNNHDGTKTWKWEVKAPINNYDLIPYIGKYVHWGETYKGLKGDLSMDYWVLDYNLDKAKKQFEDAKRMMKAFEYWFGPFPFYEDGYKLVDAPYLGMEHQSAIAYGNGYHNGYRLGKDWVDLSNTGWGFKWDFIIVHESGHEWFGNNITTVDIADMWVHEGFTNYAEALFTEYYYGKEAGDDYVVGLRQNIENTEALITPYGVNRDHNTTDIYYKGANMIHMIRQIINDDSLFRKILWGLNKTFYHQTVTTKQVEEYICKESKMDFSKVFDQYLRTIQIPTLEYKIKGKALSFHWTDCIHGFDMPVKINFKGVAKWIKPTEQWQTVETIGSDDFSVDRNFYINTKKVN